MTDTGIHTIEFPIVKVDGYHRPSDAFDKRFFIMWKLHNQIVKEARKRLEQLFRNRKYRALRCKYMRLKKEDRRAEAKEVSKLLSAIQEKYDLKGSYSFQKYAAKIRKKYSKYIQSNQIYKESYQIWDSVEDVLFGKGEEVHFRKFKDMNIISQRKIGNGIKFDLESKTGEWGLKDSAIHFSVKINWNDSYVVDSVIDSKVKYYEIKRRIFKSGYRYYLVMVMDGVAPKKMKVTEEKHTTGIDLGVSTVAAVSDDYVMLKELAPLAGKNGREIVSLQRRMEHKMKTNNPRNYNSDGTIKKGCYKWIRSKSWRKDQQTLNVLYRKKSDYTKQSHQQIVNFLVRNSSEIIIEPMRFDNLAIKTKKTEREDKESEIVTKNGEKKNVMKYKRKKRFGKTIGVRSPGLFQNILKETAKRYGVSVMEINTIKFKASQYHHDTDTYEKSKLSERFKTIQNQKVQRDLYSAFLIKNADDSLNQTNRTKCNISFDKFIVLQNLEIEFMKQNKISKKECFGF